MVDGEDKVGRFKRSVRWIGRNAANVVRWTITIGGIAAIVGRIIWPDVKIDAITLGLLGIIVLPWLGTFLESVEIPNVIKVQYRKLAESLEKVQPPTEEQATRVVKASAHGPTRTSGTATPTFSKVGPITGEQLTALPPPDKGEYVEAFEYAVRWLEGHDPELGLIGLRIEIEKSLAQILETLGLAIPPGQSAIQMLHRVVQKGAVDPNLADVLKEIIRAANQAAHGAKVDPELAFFAASEGPGMLDWLRDTEVLLRAARERAEKDLEPPTD